MGRFFTVGTVAALALVSFLPSAHAATTAEDAAIVTAGC
jgi:hypothetical protein